VELKKVLLADDSRIFRALVCEVFREHGIEVLEASNGREALDILLADRPQLAILDALMPLLSGFDVLTNLREKAPDYQPIVFIVTAVYKSRRWETEARQQHRVEEYLEKPLEPEDLLAKVRRYFPTLGDPK
jgi:DNA-binding response OmpR family regulator